MRVAIVSSEAAPFAKTGGLADMVGSLAAALARRGLDVTLVLPAYRCVLERGDVAATGMAFPVPAAGGIEQVEILAGVGGAGAQARFVRVDRFFDRDGLYGRGGTEYPDNADRFACFARAALALLARVDPPDVLHGHDWQTGLAVAYLRLQPERYPSLTSTRTLFTVHNVGYRGLFDAGVFPRLQVDSAHYWPNFEFYGNISYLKAGLSLADRLTTVSPSYAEEVKTPEQGCGLDGVFRERAGDLTGIMNGADYGVWDPAVDAFIVRRYSAADPDGKHDCKRDLQRRLSLPPSDSPLAGMVARLADQKGLDLLAGALDALLSRDLQIAVLGTGNPHHERMLVRLRPGAPGPHGHPHRLRRGAGPRHRGGQRPVPDALALRAERPQPALQPALRHDPHRARHRGPAATRSCPSTRRRAKAPASCSGTTRRRRSSEAVDRALDCFGRPDAWRRLDGERHGAGLLHGPYRRGVRRALRGTGRWRSSVTTITSNSP